MAYTHGQRQLPLVPFVLGTTQILDIPRDRICKSIDLQGDFSLVVTTASATSGTVTAQNAVRLVDQIRVVGNGVTTLFQMSGQDLYNQNAIDSGVLNEIANVATFTAGTKTLSFFMTIPFENQLGANPVDTRLNCASFQSLTLEITWTNAFVGSLVTNDNVTTNAIANTFGITPTMHESIFPAKPNFMRFQETTDVSITATTANLDQNINVSKTAIYQRLGFRSTQLADGARQPVSTNLNAMSVITGANVNHVATLPFDQLRNQNRLQSGITALTAGYAWLPLTESGMISTGLRTADTNTAITRMDVTTGSTGEIRLFTDKLEPIA